MIYCIVRSQSILTRLIRSTWTYVHGTAAVVLNNLVARLVCATADDPGFLASLVPFLWIWLGLKFLCILWVFRRERGPYNCDSVLAHVLKPYVELAFILTSLPTDLQSHIKNI